MSFLHRHLRILAVAVSCAALGAGASAIASAGAAAPAAARAKSARAAILARAVHGDLVVATSSGFASAGFDRGFVVSVAGRQLTIREGTARRTYKTLTLTIPASARVRDDGKAASLSDLRAGQRVLVWRGPQRTAVIARTPRHP